MVQISRETAEETDNRLRGVIAQATLKTYADDYVFVEFAPPDFPSAVSPAALALVRDDDVWSQLVPAAAGDDGERFAIFRFHFPAGIDNSGFVGWLATHLKRSLGTGVLVVCGQNSGNGGIFDYWGCPAELRDEVIAVVRALAAK